MRVLPLSAMSLLIFATAFLACGDSTSPSSGDGGTSSGTPGSSGGTTSGTSGTAADVPEPCAIFTKDIATPVSSKTLGDTGVSSALGKRKTCRWAPTAGGVGATFHLGAADGGRAGYDSACTGQDPKGVLVSGVGETGCMRADAPTNTFNLTVLSGKWELILIGDTGEAAVKTAALAILPKLPK